MAKAKPKSKVAGVYYRDDGRPRWEAKIRWTDRDGVKRSLPTHRWPVDPKATRHTLLHVNRARLDAEAWANEEWRSLEAHGVPRSYRAEGWTLGGLLRRYLVELEGGQIPHKAIKTERSAVRMLLGMGKGANAGGFPALMEKPIEELKYSDFVGTGTGSLQSLLKDRDGNRASEGSLRRILTVVRGVFKRAQEQWDIRLTNPLQTIKNLAVNDAREVTVKPDQWEAITAELAKHEQGTRDAIAFARWTAARRSEVAKLDWSDVDIEQKTAVLRETKSKAGKTVDRTIPLPAEAMEIISRRRQALVEADKRVGGPVFTNDKGKRVRPDSMTQAWTRACARAGVSGVRIHDLRHTRITELGRFLSAAEAARVSGHTDLSMFFRYFNPDPVETGKKIDAMENQGAAADRVKKIAEELTHLSADDFAMAIASAIEMKSRSVAGR